MFTTKNKLFKQEQYLNEVKCFYTDLINRMIDDDKDKLRVFDKNGLYLATKKIGKNNPKAEQIKEDNKVRMQWNHEVDRALVSQVPKDEIQQVKKEWITDNIRLSISLSGKHPEKLASIIRVATIKLSYVIAQVLEAANKLKEKLSADSAEKTEQAVAEIISPTTTIIEKESQPEPKPDVTITPIVTQAKSVEASKPQIPPKPVIPPDASAYTKLSEIKAKLDKHNRIIIVNSYLQIYHHPLSFG